MDLIKESWRKAWNNWEIRLLVLISLFLQAVLIITGNRRKYKSSSWVSAIVWLCYLSADAVATVAIGILTRTREEDSNPNNILMAFWAPILLLHLGGPDTITAYALADNELWLRHFLALFVQFGVAFYVFLKSWNGSLVNYLSIVMFVAGLTKYGERTVALWSASRDRYRKSMLSPPDPGPNYAKFMDEFKSRKHEGYIVRLGKSMDVSQVVDEPPKKGSNSKIPQITEMHYANYFFNTFKKLFADLILSFQDKKNSQFFFKKESWETVFLIVEVELGLIYDLLYTKASIIHSSVGLLLRCFTLTSSIAVFVAFSISDRSLFSSIEVGITYTLLIGAIVLEVYAIMIMLSSDWTMIWLTDSSNLNFFRFREKISYPIYRGVSFLGRSLLLVPSKRRWSAKMNQYNFFVLCINRDKESKWSTILRFWGFYRFLEKHLIPNSLKGLVFEKIKAIKDDQGNSSTRLDQEILRRKDCLGTENEDLNFDQSVLIWHIATDLCYHTDDDPEITISEADKKSWLYDFDFSQNDDENYYKFIREMSKWLSDYMFYLLIVCPFMLPSGIGQIRFEDTHAEAMEFLEEGKLERATNIQSACQKLLRVNTEHHPSEVKGDRSKSVLFDACRLVHSLNNSNQHDKRERWETIFSAWVDILCYAAAECYWSDHADQLRRGGELLTHVWLLMAHFGLTSQFQISRGYVRAKWQLD